MASSALSQEEEVLARDFEGDISLWKREPQNDGPNIGAIAGILLKTKLDCCWCSVVEYTCNANEDVSLSLFIIIYHWLLPLDLEAVYNGDY